MNRTLSKERIAKKSQLHSNQRTEKKKPKCVEMSLVTKSNVWLNKQKISVFIQENTFNRAIGYHQEAMGTEKWCALINKKHLKIQNPPHIKINRARILDWLLDVCRAFQLRWQSYWCCVQILDFLIFTVDCVKVSNIHLVAVTCLFISIKIHDTNIPTLHKIIQKAVYGVFSQNDVISLQAQILILISNSQIKPRYLDTIYNYLYQLYPLLPLKPRTQAMRRLILIWMDPVTVLKMQAKNKNGGNFYSNREDRLSISYSDIVMIVVKGIEEDHDLRNFNQVHQFYKNKYQCENLEVCWPGFDKIRP